MTTVILAGVLSAAFAMASPAAIQPHADTGIRILRAEFGTLGTKRKLDIAERLQALCGSQGESCSVFCSETSFGRFRVGRRPICRVIYRCPEGSTKSIEAAREEPISMSCPDDAEEDAPGAGQADQPQPPPYVPPKPKA